MVLFGLLHVCKQTVWLAVWRRACSKASVRKQYFMFFSKRYQIHQQVSTLQIKQENCSLTRAIWLKAFILRWCSIETLKRNACFCCCDHSDQPTQQKVSRAAAGSLFRAFCWPHVKIQLSFRYTPVTTKSASIKEIIWHCIETIYLKSELCC